jgi:predicted 3-demethylubiquinone-9 3-methyltransferase (glyoxalase superfamily)
MFFRDYILVNLKTMKKIVPCLWYDNEAEEAVKFYSSLFGDTKILSVSRYPEGGPMPAGTVMAIQFTLRGQEFLALNGGPMYTFTEAVSFIVNCKDQAEIDKYWEGLSDGGVTQPCGWLKDRYGLSWQIVPEKLTEMISDADPARSQRVMQALWQMEKPDIRKMEEAWNKE